MRSRLPEMAVSTVGDYARDLDGRAYREAKGFVNVQARRLEKVLTIGNWLYKAVRRIERDWRDEVLAEKSPYDPGEDQSLMEMIRQWSQAGRRCLVEIEALRAKGVRVRGSIRFERSLGDATEILAGRNPFFDDLEKAWRWFALTAPFRQSPRPVRIDDQGRIFEATGERFVAPGVRPEDLLRAISDTSDDQGRPLKDIIAERTRDGV